MMSVSLSSSTVGATSNTETAYSSGTPEFTSGFVDHCLPLFPVPLGHCIVWPSIDSFSSTSVFSGFHAA